MQDNLIRINISFIILMTGRHFANSANAILISAAFQIAMKYCTYRRYFTRIINGHFKAFFLTKNIFQIKHFMLVN